MIEAFNEWCRASLTAESLSDSATEAERQPYSSAISRAEEALAMPAETAAGVEVKLLHVFATVAESPDAYSAVWSGTHLAPDGGALSDSRHAMLWGAIQDLRRIVNRSAQSAT
ncbi:hypothetical protein D3877_11325 [Azospirillum cavernae]|uniref:Uncharacterized protein n=1 Tax=Azospirillum cavernae TaxID=2320860 RepID=A0A418W4T5_9PROT|nr:hypothetical protein D3877_11325 [Azospirillum cavernae]